MPQLIRCACPHFVAYRRNMAALAATRRRVSHGYMDTKSNTKAPNPKAIAMGAAIQSLREQKGMSQDEAAAALHTSRQTISNYERGERSVILREDIQQDVAEALGVTREDILRERDRLAGTEPQQYAPPQTATIYELPVLGRVRTGPEGPMLYGVSEPDQIVDLAWMFGPNAKSLRQAGDEMSGYVESGQLVIYDTSQWPRRGDGCVVELRSGDVYVREYVSTAQGVLTVRQRLGDETSTFPMSDVKGVYTIRLRGE